MQRRLGLLLALALAIGMGLAFVPATQDDAFISFRYAANLVDGHGLVYNVGERVEGYTNLSWTLLLAGFMALGADPVPVSVILGLVGLVGMVLSAAFLAPSSSWWPAVAAAALVAADPLSALEAVEGLEGTFFAAICAFALGLAVREAERDQSPWGSAALFGVAVLTRPEAPLIAGLCYLALGRWRGLLPVAATLGLLTAWRVAYYGDPLPNTFYAKTGGLFWERGLLYLWVHAKGHPALWLLGATGAWTARREALGRASALIIAGWTAYVVAVGGDFKPTGRFLLPMVPLLAGLAARCPPRAALLLVPGLAVQLAAWGSASAWAEERRANFHARRDLGIFLGESLPPGSWLAIHSAGAVPYYSGLPTIDMWGLADHHIARTRPPAMGEGMAGHEKSDPAYVFGRRPLLYIPEDRGFTLKPQPLQPDPGFPPDFVENYELVHVPVDGRWLNAWQLRSER